jgi:hypothetical protein
MIGRLGRTKAQSTTFYARRLRRHRPRGCRTHRPAPEEVEIRSFAKILSVSRARLTVFDDRKIGRWSPDKALDGKTFGGAFGWEPKLRFP